MSHGVDSIDLGGQDAGGRFLKVANPTNHVRMAKRDHPEGTRGRGDSFVDKGPLGRGAKAEQMEMEKR